MRVLVATDETDPRDGGFSYTVPGELLGQPTVCSKPGCGCRWAFAGVASDKATTLALVADRPELDAVDDIDDIGWTAEVAAAHEVGELLVLWIPDANSLEVEVWHLDEWIDEYGLVVDPGGDEDEEW